MVVGGGYSSNADACKVIVSIPTDNKGTSTNPYGNLC